MKKASVLGTMPTPTEAPLLLSRLLDRGAIIQPDNSIFTRLSDGSWHSVTFAEEAANARRLASALRKRGVQEGDRVASFCWNTQRHCTLYHAVPCMGAVLHTLNVRLSGRELAYIIDHAQDRIFFLDADLLKNLAEVDRSVLQAVDLFVVCGEDERPGGWDALVPQSLRGLDIVDYDEFIASGDSDASDVWANDLDENAAAALCYTSGTTGRPKGVAYSHRSTYLHTMSASMVDFHAVSGTDTLLPVVPMFHAMGWGLPFSCLMLGTRLVLMNKYNDPASILSGCVDHGVTYSAAVPTIWSTIQNTLNNGNTLASYRGRFKVERVVCGGSAPPPAMMRFFYDNFGTQFMQGWGMTETNPHGALSKFVQKRKHREWDVERQFGNTRNAGLLMPGLEMKIVDPENLSRELPWDGEAAGELLVRGPWVTSSYYNERYPDKFHNGWLDTGDIASVNPDGALILRDRSKDLIKSGGEWISSVDLEKHISTLDAIELVAVVAVPHPKWDERPVVVATTTLPESQHAALRESVRKHCAEEFAKYEVPDDVLFWETLHVSLSPTCLPYKHENGMRVAI